MRNHLPCRSTFPALVVAIFLLITASFPAAAADPASDEGRSGIELAGHSVAELGSDRDVPAELKSFDGPGSDVALVKFPGPVSAEQRRALERRVERVFTYLPHDAFLVRVAPTKAADLVETVGAAWTAPYHPAYKIGPSVDAFAERSAKGRAPRSVMVHVFPDVDLAGLRADLEERGVRVTAAEERERFSRLRLLATPAELKALRHELAQRAEVFFFDLEARKVLLNDTTAWVSQTGTSGGQQTPIHDAGILGDGQIVGVLDTGIDPDMCFFRDTVNGLPATNLCNGGTSVDLSQRKVIAVDFLHSGECSGGISSGEWDNQDHGTHVAGTIAGDNFANPGVRDSADGMAPAARLVIQDGGFATDNCADLPALGCPVVDLNPIFQQAYDQGARIHSNSWGDDENNPTKGLYSAGSEDSDQFVWNNKDFLLVYAAGNDGPGNGRIGSPATAKNVVAVGATLRGSSADSMASFSSCGPTQDGRIKPDVTLPGSSIVSANSDNNPSSNNCNTKSSSGTSMAAPGVAGAAALVREYYVDGFYPSGSANAGDSLVPSAALLKATLVNSGQDMTGVSGWPANCEGWGRVALDDTLELTGDSRSLFVDDNAGFAQGSSNQTVTYALTVSSSSEPLKVTLAWSDYPSTPAAGTHLVNDLDLEVTGPGGTWLGNVFSGGASTTGGSADRLNTVEQVLLPSPTAGTYTVTVRSFTVPQGPQPFALVASGDVAECSGGCNATPSVAITAPADGTFVSEGDPVSFVGTASDVEDGNLSASLAWTSSIDGSIGSGASFSTSSLSQGAHTITAAVTDSGGANGSDSITLNVTPAGQNGPQDASYDAGLGAPACAVPGSECDSLGLVDGRASLGPESNAPNTLDGCSDGGSGSYHSDESVDRVIVRTLDGLDFTAGATVEVEVTVWAYSTGSSDTLDLYYAADANNPSWTLIGSQTPSGGGAQTLTAQYTLPAGPLQAVRAGFRYQGSETPCSSGNYDEADDLVFAVGTGGGGGGGGCDLDEDFSGGAAGWTTSGTCATGQFVLGTPTLVTNGGVTTQPAGDHTTGSGNALYTAPNSNAGRDDVDGGTCIVTSPVYPVSALSDVSAWYFHGQRDAGDDSGDFFLLEISTNGGSSWSTLASYGDQTVNAVWTEATTTVGAGTNVVFRVSVADGAGAGDLVEAGLDDLSICPQ